MRTARSIRAALLALALTLGGAGAAQAAQTVIADPAFETIVAETKAAMLADPLKAIAEAGRAQDHARAVRDPDTRDLELATTEWLLAEAYSRTRSLDRARTLIDRALGTARRLAPDGALYADALLSRGSILAARGDVGGALRDFHAAHERFRQSGDVRSRARTLVLIATLYYDANDRQSALRYFGQALEIYRSDPGLAVAIHNGRGMVYTDLKRLPAAVGEFRAALAIARDMKSPMLSATVLNNLARVYLIQGDIAAADRAIADSVRLGKDAGITALRARQLQLAAQAALQRGDPRRAAALIAQVFAGADLSRTTLADREAHQTAYDSYRALKRDDLALAHLAALKRLDDEATELARSNGAALMAARFDFANQELRIANLKADDLQKSVAFERSRARTQRIVLLSGVAVTLLIIGMLGFGLVTIRRSRDKVRAANADLEETNGALEKALAAKTEFLATTSHEIRTPLNGILGMTQVVLADAGVDRRTRDRVEVVHAAGVTMRALVDDILDVAKMETGALTIEPIAFDLCAELTDALRLWEDQARDKGLGFTADLGTCPQRILGDRGRIRQIVFNLLSNALKFTPEGSVHVSAAVADGRIRIAVADTGIGIAPAQHEEIFEMFRQADTTTTRRFGGTGLGLAICRRLSRAMGGDVRVESALDRGAVFTLELPLTVPAEGDAREAAAPAAALVIDANPIQRAMLKAVVASGGETLIDAADAATALSAADGRPIARILADEAALATDPAAAIAGLRARAGDAAPIVVLCAAGSAIDAAALHGAGASAVLFRPVTKTALRESIFIECGSTSRPEIVTQAA